MLKDLILKNRSYRRFDPSESVTGETLKGLIELARLSPSAANLQPLKYIISNDPESNALVFPHLVWAGYLTDWPGPGDGERPSAYIIILCDQAISKAAGCDHGIAAQSILLGSAEKGLGGCMIGSIKREKLREALNIPGQYDILLVIALGKPREKVCIEETSKSGNIKYWRDEEGVHHVPKRYLGEMILPTCSDGTS